MLTRQTRIGRFMLWGFIAWLLLSVISFLIFFCNETGTLQTADHHSEGKGTRKSMATFLVILILCSPNERVRRDAIRSTWLTYAAGDTRPYFVIGTRGISNPSELETEAAIYEDILQLSDLSDSYETLTDKVLSAFVWLSENVDFSYLLKLDSDSFARIDIIVEELRSRRYSDDSARSLYLGFFDGRARVKKTGQWAEHRWMLCDRYLPHARGGGYVLSSDLIYYLARNARLLQRFNNEDVSVGAWLAPLNIERQHDPRFDTEHVSRGCSNAYIVTHKQSTEDMRNKFQSLRKTGGHLCDFNGEFRTRMSYVYNWSVLPSLCCNRTDSTVP